MTLLVKVELNVHNSLRGVIEVFSLLICGNFGLFWVYVYQMCNPLSALSDYSQGKSI